MTGICHRFRGLGWRILGNEMIDGVKMTLGSIGPMDFHSAKPYFLLTSLTSVVLPA